MFKCKECGNEYEIKPDYCDCGNDEFEEVIEQEDTLQREFVKEKSETVDYIYTGKLQKQELIEVESIRSIKSESIRPLSWVIFCLCIFFSFVVIFFIWNPKPIVKNVEDNHIEENLNLPSINSLWNDSYTKSVDRNVKKKTTPQAVNNIIRPILTTNKPVSIPVSKKVSNQNNINIESKKNDNETTKLQPVKHIVKPVSQPTAKPVKKEVVNKQVLIDYKIALRNAIGRKIDFTKVIGDGDCEVVFKVSRQGSLIERSFSRQSNNMTLNDAVYYAVMATPSFNPPPSNYNNEQLTLYVKFYNGNFEIDIK